MIVAWSRSDYEHVACLWCTCGARWAIPGILNVAADRATHACPTCGAAFADERERVEAASALVKAVTGGEPWRTWTMLRREHETDKLGEDVAALLGVHERKHPVTP